MRLSIFAATILSVAAAPAWANSINFTGSTVTATLYDPNLSTVLGGADRGGGGFRHNLP